MESTIYSFDATNFVAGNYCLVDGEEEGKRMIMLIPLCNPSAFPFGLTWSEGHKLPIRDVQKATDERNTFVVALHQEHIHFI